MKNSFNFVKNTFLKLTSKTYPYGTEDDLVEEMTKAGVFPNLEKDRWGNYFYAIGKSKTIFTSHLDTACRDQVKVNHIISKQQIITTDGKTILGADDKAGVTILLWMIKNEVPGLYYFFMGEEVGCVGSSSAAIYGPEFRNYDRMISFDRRGTNSVITFQSSYRTCSDKFAKELSRQLNLTANMFYRPDDTGVYTDSAEFVDVIPECTNISVGYQAEHTFSESQDLYHLNKLAIACLEVKWEELPINRIAGSRENKWNSYSSYSSKTSTTDVYDSYYNNSFSAKEYYNEEYYNEECEDYYAGRVKIRSNRRKRRRHSKSRTYYDNGGALVEFAKPSKGIWDIHRDKFLASDLSSDELNFVKENFLDMSKEKDKNQYEELAKFLK